MVLATRTAGLFEAGHSSCWFFVLVVRQSSDDDFTIDCFC